MLMPKRVKYRKQFRGRMKGKATRGNTVAFGEFGLQSLEPAWITSIIQVAGQVPGHRTARHRRRCVMQVQEIRNTGTADIQKKLEDAQEEYFNLRFRRASGQLEDYTQIRIVRRDIARLLTILREREIAEWIGAEEGKSA